MPRSERDEVGHLAPGNVAPHPGIYDLLLGSVRRHPGSRANDCLAWNDGIKLAASPEDGRAQAGDQQPAGSLHRHRDRVPRGVTGLGQQLEQTPARRVCQRPPKLTPDGTANLDPLSGFGRSQRCGVVGSLRARAARCGSGCPGLDSDRCAARCRSGSAGVWPARRPFRGPACARHWPDRVRNRCRGGGDIAVDRGSGRGAGAAGRRRGSGAGVGGVRGGHVCRSAAARRGVRDHRDRDRCGPGRWAGAWRRSRRARRMARGVRSRRAGCSASARGGHAVSAAAPVEGQRTRCRPRRGGAAGDCGVGGAGSREPLGAADEIPSLDLGAGDGRRKQPERGRDPAGRTAGLANALGSRSQSSWSSGTGSGCRSTGTP
jgi:hypothetical protein